MDLAAVSLLMRYGQQETKTMLLSWPRSGEGLSSLHSLSWRSESQTTWQVPSSNSNKQQVQKLTNLILGAVLLCVSSTNRLFTAGDDVIWISFCMLLAHHYHHRLTHHHHHHVL